MCLQVISAGIFAGKLLLSTGTQSKTHQYDVCGVMKVWRAIGGRMAQVPAAGAVPRPAWQEDIGRASSQEPAGGNASRRVAPPDRRVGSIHAKEALASTTARTSCDASLLPPPRLRKLCASASPGSRFWVPGKTATSFSHAPLPAYININAAEQMPKSPRTHSPSLSAPLHPRATPL